MTKDKYTVGPRSGVIRRYVQAVDGWFCYIRKNKEWEPEGFSYTFPTTGCLEEEVDAVQMERVICLEDIC